MSKGTVIFGILGTTLDVGKGSVRWERWRPNVSLCQQEDLEVARLELLYPRSGMNLARQVKEDIAQVSPQTTVNLHPLDPRDPWDFEEVYSGLHDFASGYRFDPEREEYLVHITTGTHVAQICLFLLTETRRFPAKLIQTSPGKKDVSPAGTYRIIDLDLSKYDSIADRFARESRDNALGLKSGIATRNGAFNLLIDELERVAAGSTDPLLLTGPTGAGKSQLARRVFELKKHRRQIEGELVEINCATLRGDGAMSTLFGHRKGAFTGATSDRAGLLRAAHRGVLFLDEIGELGLDEQAMLLRAIEEKRFRPLGDDSETSADFQLIAGTNRDLRARVGEGLFREDLLARINLWTFQLPALRQRPEDIEPNLDYELEQFARRSGRQVRMSTEAREAYLKFAIEPGATWPGNFRDLGASVTRMCTLSPGGRVSLELASAEIARLRSAWKTGPSALSSSQDRCDKVLTPAQLEALDRFERVQLNDVLEVCATSPSLSHAGRVLFAASRTRRASVNDADRVRKYLARYGLDWDSVRAG